MTIEFQALAKQFHALKAENERLQSEADELYLAFGFATSWRRFAAYARQHPDEPVEGLVYGCFGFKFDDLQAERREALRRNEATS